MHKLFAISMLTVALSGALAVSESQAATFKSGLHHGCDCITISGEIKHGDGLRFTRLADQLQRSGTPASKVLLNSNGGDLGEAVEIAQYIHENQMNTIVEGTKTCGSACFLIFASGYFRYANPHAQMYVHRVMESNRDTSYAKSVSVELNEQYRAFNVPDNIRLAMLDTPPHKAYKLTAQDIRNMNNTSSHSGVVTHHKPNHSDEQSSSSSSSTSIASPNHLDLKDDGIALIKRGNYKVGIKKLEKCKKTFSNDPEVFFNLGFAYAMIHDYNRAQKNLQKTVELQPTKGVAWKNLAEVQAQQGQITKAADSYVYYWENVKDRKRATNTLYDIVKKHPGSNRAKAAKKAIMILGL